MNKEVYFIDRRDFLRTSAAVGAGLMINGSAVSGAESGGGDELNVAIIGAGSQGQVLLDACMGIKGLRFRAVCDIWEDFNLRKVSRRLKAYGHENNAYVDYKRMLAEEKGLDAVIVATPDFWHSTHTIDCLNAGVHVYCEKEMSNTLESAREMVMAAKDTGKLLQIGHQRRSNPRYLHCYNKIIKEAGLLGRITAINGQWNRAARPDLGRPEKYAIEPAVLKKYGFDSMHQFMNWRWYKGLGGGPLVDLGSHQIDIYSWFLEKNPSAVTASGGTDYYSSDTHEWYDTVMAVFEYTTEHGAVRAFYQVLTTNSNGGYYETFMGDEGTLFISESASRGAVYREPSSPKWDKWVRAGYIYEPEIEQEAEETDTILDVRETVAPPAYELTATMQQKYHQPHLQNFFDAVRGEAELNCPAEEAYQTAVAVLRANEAVEKGCRIDLKEAEFKV